MMRKWIILGIITLTAAFVGQAQENLDKLPAKALEIVKVNYADNEIDKVNADEDSYQVKFKNGTKIDFNENGEATQISGDEKVPYALIPTKMKYFLENR